jgi:multidrug resistance protein, MATE family
VISRREALGLAASSAAFTVLTRAFRLVDQYFVQFVSTPAQAAVGTSIFVMVLFFAVVEVVAVGTAPFVARATGAQDPEDRAFRIGNGLVCTGLVAAATTVAGRWGADGVGGLLGLQGEASRALGAYLRALATGSIFLALAPLVDQCFIAMGRARVPALLHGLSFLLNALATPWFVFGWDLGVMGAAWGTVLARGVASSVGVLWLLRHVGLRPVHAVLRPLDMFRVGGPVALASSMFALVYWGLLRFAISPLGPEVNAALGIGFSALEGITWPLFHGVGLALASAVGRSLGAGRPDGAWQALGRFLPLSLTLGGLAWAVFWFLGSPWTGLFAADPGVHAEAIRYARALAWSQPFVAVESLLEGVIFGSGHTAWMLRISAPLNVLRIPLAVALAHGLGWGADGVWWAVNFTTFAKAGLHAGVVLQGSWTRGPSVSARTNE